MRFLVVTKQSTPPPPEMAIGLLEALSAWARRHQESGKIEQTWGFVGLPAGGGIMNVESLEELDGIMAEFPMGPFSTIEILGLVELEPALQRARNAIQAMMPGGR
jgi:muconolactone delta-isomerase